MVASDVFKAGGLSPYLITDSATWERISISRPSPAHPAFRLTHTAHPVPASPPQHTQSLPHPPSTPSPCLTAPAHPVPASHTQHTQSLPCRPSTPSPCLAAPAHPVPASPPQHTQSLPHRPSTPSHCLAAPAPPVPASPPPDRPARPSPCPLRVAAPTGRHPHHSTTRGTLCSSRGSDSAPSAGRPRA